MKDEMQKLVDQYVNWLKDRTSLREVKDWVEITTPYLDRHNDYLQIYVKRQNGSYLLTDDGYIIDDLLLSGCKLDSPKRQALLKMALNGFGVKLADGKRLEVNTSEQDFPARKHSLIQAMLAINDMFYLAAPLVANLFVEDVIAWLDIHDIRYTPQVKFTGKSGYDHLFDFVIPKSRSRPERVIQALNSPSRISADNLNWAWFDTLEVRSEDSCLYAFLNDSEVKVPSAVLDALHIYNINPVVWSKREEVRSELAA